MGSLSYTATVSLDGYVVDADGDFQWSGPDDEVSASTWNAWDRSRTRSSAGRPTS